MPLMTPAVTLGSVLPSRKPYGLPIAIAHSPMMQLVRVAERRDGQVLRVDLEHGEIVRLVLAERASRDRSCRRASRRRSSSRRDDVRVRDDHAIRAHDEAGAEPG